MLLFRDYRAVDQEIFGVFLPDLLLFYDSVIS